MNTMIKTLKARRYVGFYAYYRGDSRLDFKRVLNAAGLPILYKTRQAALDAATLNARADFGIMPAGGAK